MKRIQFSIIVPALHESDTINFLIDHLNSFEALRLRKNLYEGHLRKALEGKEKEVVTCGGQ